MSVQRISMFRIGELYSSEEIQHSLGVGNAGGVRLCIGDDDSVRRTVIMTSVPTARQAKENPYHDRIEGDTLVYTGAGREGDQSLAGVNKRLARQGHASFPMYGFLIVGSRRDPSVGPKRWRFLGLLEYLRHYPDTQVDTRGTVRKVWLFEFRIHSKPEEVIVDKDYHTSEMILKVSRAEDRNRDDECALAESPIVVGMPTQEFDPVELEGIRGYLLAKSPELFEHFIKDLLIATGYERVNVTKFSQDGGIDVNAHASAAMWPVENMLVQIQAKRWLHTVGRNEVAVLRGSLEPFARGAVVTTSHYSKAAISEASSAGKAPIVLVDGYSLARIVRHIGIKVD
ncbi:MAG: restriction endonuclease [Planctomycetes bacterium]|nr:restriction endonuclease [Planctomycetota bacterium]